MFSHTNGNPAAAAHRIVVKFVRAKGLLAGAQGEASAGMFFFDRLGNPMTGDDGSAAGFASRFAIALKAGFAASASAAGEGATATATVTALALGAAAADAGFALDTGEAEALLSWIGGADEQGEGRGGRIDLAAFTGDGEGDGELILFLGGPDQLFGIADFLI
jgi:hypothetical protein